MKKLKKIAVDRIKHVNRPCPAPNLDKLLSFRKQPNVEPLMVSPLFCHRLISPKYHPCSREMCMSPLFLRLLSTFHGNVPKLK